MEKISLCLITKNSIYPKEILDHVSQFPWGEVLILTHSDSPFKKYELFNKANFDIVAYQDDDAICPWLPLFQQYKPGIINLIMKAEHFEAYKDKRYTMGLGWGAIFPKQLLQSLTKYTALYGEDELFKRETERILTYLNYPQNRIILPVMDLPSAYAADRLWRQPGHYENIKIVEERCKLLI